MSFPSFHVKLIHSIGPMSGPFVSGHLSKICLSATTTGLVSNRELTCINRHSTKILTFDEPSIPARTVDMKV